MNEQIPFRFECRPLLKIDASDAANDGFSATIKTVLMLMIIYWQRWQMYYK